MSMTDPIADFLARIRNGIRARKLAVCLARVTLFGFRVTITAEIGSRFHPA